MLKNKLSLCIFALVCAGVISSCGKKEEPQNTFVPPNQEFSDKEKELKEKEEFLRLKEEQMKNQGDTTKQQTSTQNPDSLKQLTEKKDTVKTTKEQPKKQEKKEFVKKEKDLNKRLDNPKSAIDDYLEYIKRGVSGDGNFDKNMSQASELWKSRSKNTFKNAYKNTKEFIVVSEPEVVSQKGNTATVKVKLKQVDKVNSKDKATEMTVTYNLVADGNGKWKISGNKINRK